MKFHRPRGWRLLILVVTCVVAVAVVGVALTQPSTSRTATPIRQQIAIPAYISPTADSAAWIRLIGSSNGAVGIAVVNILNGPTDRRSVAWSTVIRKAHHSGIEVLGYVDTGYLGATGLLTRGGSGTVAAWKTQIERDISAWYAFYGPNIAGIFFDDTPTTCGSTARSDGWSNTYRSLTGFVKMNHPGAVTALNPGAAVPRCYEDAANSLVTFEGSYTQYTAPSSSSPQAYQPLGWSSHVRGMIWQIIYGVPSAAIGRVVALSKARNSSYLFVTNATPPNPYDVLPGPAYWLSEQQQVNTSGHE